MAKLTFVLEDGQEEVPLADRLTLGRAEDNDVVVDDERLSKHHAEIICHPDGRVEVRDLSSTSGTLVNGESVECRVLRHGDQLSFGPLTAVLDLEETDAPAEEKEGKPAAPSDTKPPADEPQRLQAEVAAVRQELAEWRLRAEQERTAHETRLRTLRTAEERLLPLQAAAKHAETTHGEWLTAIHALTAEHEQKSTDLQKLAEDETAAHARLEALATEQRQEIARLEQCRQEAERETDSLEQSRQQAAEKEAAAKSKLDALTAQQEQENSRLEQLRKDCASEQSHLGDLRKQATSAESAVKASVEALYAQQEQEKARLAQLRQDFDQEAVRMDELRRQIAQIEPRGQELQKQAEAAAENRLLEEEKLKQALALFQETEARHKAQIATLNSESQNLEATVKEAQTRVTSLQEMEKLSVAAAADSLAARQREEKVLGELQAEISECKNDLASTTSLLEEKQAALTDATQRLAEVASSLDDAVMRRASIEAQCQELAAAGAQLEEVRGQLVALSAGAARLAEQEHRARKFEAEVEAAQQRLSELEAREATLRAEAESLAATITANEDALKQIRQHAARQAELGRAIETARKELADLSARLTPMRDWKEAMDLLYARFADLPQSSTEAQEVWREIEAGKAALRRHILASQMRAPRIMHIEFARNTKPGTPMKSERVRGKAQA
jgi:pSer/pThr/pTyr-binding forkhead associated (FHA) protein